MRIFILQNLYDLADMKTMYEIIDSRAFSEFCDVNSPNQVPDGDTIGRFRNILERNGIQEKIFKQVVEILTKKGLILKRGTIVDSTLIAAPASTKNKKKNAPPKPIPRRKETNGILVTKRILVSIKEPVWCIRSRLRERLCMMLLGNRHK